MADSSGGMSSALPWTQLIGAGLDHLEAAKNGQTDQFNKWYQDESRAQAPAQAAKINPNTSGSKGLMDLLSGALQSNGSQNTSNPNQMLDQEQNEINNMQVPTMDPYAQNTYDQMGQLNQNKFNLGNQSNALNDILGR